MRQRALVWSTVIAVALLAAHACGYRFGVANQATYFLHALHRAHPELFRQDWLISATSEYHKLFGILAGWMFGLDDSGVTVFAITHVILMVVLLVGVFLLVRATTTRALAVYVVLVGWLLVDGDRSLAGSYVWSGYLQPSLIGAAGTVFGLAMFVRGRPLATGIALAAGGLFHANFLLLGIGAFGLAELVTSRNWKRVAWLLLPQVVALAILVPEILAHAASRDSARALWVLVEFHAPVHYRGLTIARSLPGFVPWIVLAIVVAPVIASEVTRRLVWWLGIVGGLCTLGTVVVMVPVFEPLTRLYVWRLAPFAVLAAQLVIVLASLDGRAWLLQPWWRRVIAIALFAYLAIDLPVMWFLVLPLVWSRALVITAIVSLALPLWALRDRILHPAPEIESEGPDVDALYAWARTTPIDTVFVSPPSLGRFRLITRRASYADFKSPPLDPDDLVEWHDRLVAMDGAKPDDKIPAHQQAWLTSTGDDLLARTKRLSGDYLVLDRTPAHDQIAAAPVFQNARFQVYQVAR
ncbi:MAG: hypothetical protein QM831_14365 [Kofleriaceae bacterium]